MLCVRDPDVPQHDREIVARKRRARCLRGDGDRAADPGAVAVALRADEIEPTASAVLFLKRERRLNLAQFECGQLVGFVAATMILQKDLVGFGAAAAGDEPAG